MRFQRFHPTKWDKIPKVIQSSISRLHVRFEKKVANFVLLIQKFFGPKTLSKTLNNAEDFVVSNFLPFERGTFHWRDGSKENLKATVQHDCPGRFQVTICYKVKTTSRLMILRDRKWKIAMKIYCSCSQKWSWREPFIIVENFSIKGFLFSWWIIHHGEWNFRRILMKFRIFLIVSLLSPKCSK